METLEKIDFGLESIKQIEKATAKSKKLRIFYILLGVGIVLLVVGLVSLLFL
jgi:hypothetical protein